MRRTRGIKTGVTSIATALSFTAVLLLVLGGILAAQQLTNYKEDINGDGRVNVLDVLALMLLGRNDHMDPKADYDGDGHWTMADAVTLLRNIAGGNLTEVEPPPPPPPANRTWFVDTRDNVFVPDSLAIAVGDTVTWTNSGAMVHTATSGPNGSPDGIFNSGNLATNQSYSFVFTQAGIYPYYCIPHYFIGMVGKIVVLAPQGTGF